MPKRSAGILLFRRVRGELEVFLVHPGGPFWARKDLGAWTIPKGEIEPGEEPAAVARREFEEETGALIREKMVPLATIKQAGGKIVEAWAVEGDFDPERLRSNTFTMEWPPRSGRSQEFPEVDRAAWFGLAEARAKFLPSQLPLLDRLAELLARPQD
ncbi:MAG: NUDIX domain-containing protein [Gemmatimonadales bacterium]